MDFLWRKISEEEKEKIKRDSKEMMDSFSKKLSKIKDFNERALERVDGDRVEKYGVGCSPSFRKILFDNAPNKNNDFITAEKKEW